MAGYFETAKEKAKKVYENGMLDGHRVNDVVTFIAQELEKMGSSVAEQAAAYLFLSTNPQNLSRSQNMLTPMSIATEYGIDTANIVTELNPFVQDNRNVLDINWKSKGMTLRHASPAAQKIFLLQQLYYLEHTAMGVSALDHIAESLERLVVFEHFYKVYPDLYTRAFKRVAYTIQSSGLVLQAEAERKDPTANIYRDMIFSLFACENGLKPLNFKTYMTDKAAAQNSRVFVNEKDFSRVKRLEMFIAISLMNNKEFPLDSASWLFAELLRKSKQNAWIPVTYVAAKCLITYLSKMVTKPQDFLASVYKYMPRLEMQDVHPNFVQFIQDVHAKKMKSSLNSTNNYNVDEKLNQFDTQFNENIEKAFGPKRKNNAPVQHQATAGVSSQMGIVSKKEFKERPTCRGFMKNRLKQTKFFIEKTVENDSVQILNDILFRRLPYIDSLQTPHIDIIDEIHDVLKSGISLHCDKWSDEIKSRVSQIDFYGKLLEATVRLKQGNEFINLAQFMSTEVMPDTHVGIGEDDISAPTRVGLILEIATGLDIPISTEKIQQIKQKLNEDNPIARKVKDLLCAYERDSSVKVGERNNDVQSVVPVPIKILGHDEAAQGTPVKITSHVKSARNQRKKEAQRQGKGRSRFDDD